ncbi:MAG: polyprenyl synthetase family protein [Candidatus Eisenbacteria bacterium]|nr:polyprenyl synthetase family protein [Candidatus Eisenbacteria bacterium]
MELKGPQGPIARELEEVEEQMKAALFSNRPLIQKVGSHLLATHGKRFRPTVLLLSAKLDGNLPPLAVCAATVVELIHTATLIHDDSIDKSELRRGCPTVNSMWDDDVSIAMGDFIYSKAFSILVNNEMYDVMQVLAEASHRMSVGELLELEKRNDLDITEEDYMTIIADKTASLMSASCEIGTMLGSPGDGTRECFSRYGHAVGVAFQITDDLFDYVGHARELGKSVGNDIRGGKITLPLIATLKNATSRDRARILDIIASSAFADGRWEELLTLMNEYDGIGYSRKRALAYAVEAKQTIRPFEDSPYYTHLCSAVDYTVERRQ